MSEDGDDAHVHGASSAMSRRADPRSRRLGLPAAARSRSGERGRHRPEARRLADDRRAAAPPDHVGRVPRQEPRFRPHERPDGRHQGDRARRAAVHRPVGSRDRPEHPARPLRAGRDPLRAAHAEARRFRDRRRRPHRLLHHADGGDGRAGRARLRLRAVRRELRICSSDRLPKTGSPIASAFSARRSARRRARRR